MTAWSEHMDGAWQVCRVRDWLLLTVAQWIVEQRGGTRRLRASIGTHNCRAQQNGEKSQFLNPGRILIHWSSADLCSNLPVTLATSYFSFFRQVKPLSTPPFFVSALLLGFLFIYFLPLNYKDVLFFVRSRSLTLFVSYMMACHTVAPC